MHLVAKDAYFTAFHFCAVDNCCIYGKEFSVGCWDMNLLEQN